MFMFMINFINVFRYDLSNIYFVIVIIYLFIFYLLDFFYSLNFIVISA